MQPQQLEQERHYGIYKNRVVWIQKPDYIEKLAGDYNIDAKYAAAVINAVLETEFGANKIFGTYKQTLAVFEKVNSSEEFTNPIAVESQHLIVLHILLALDREPGLYDLEKNGIQMSAEEIFKVIKLSGRTLSNISDLTHEIFNDIGNHDVEALFEKLLQLDADKKHEQGKSESFWQNHIEQQLDTIDIMHDRKNAREWAERLFLAITMDYWKEGNEISEKYIMLFYDQLVNRFPSMRPLDEFKSIYMDSLFQSADRANVFTSLTAFYNIKFSELISIYHLIRKSLSNGTVAYDPARVHMALQWLTWEAYTQEESPHNLTDGNNGENTMYKLTDSQLDKLTSDILGWIERNT